MMKLQNAYQENACFTLGLWDITQRRRTYTERLIFLDTEETLTVHPSRSSKSCHHTSSLFFIPLATL